MIKRSWFIAGFYPLMNGDKQNFDAIVHTRSIISNPDVARDLALNHFQEIMRLDKDFIVISAMNRV